MSLRGRSVFPLAVLAGALVVLVLLCRVRLLRYILLVTMVLVTLQ